MSHNLQRTPHAAGKAASPDQMVIDGPQRDEESILRGADELQQGLQGDLDRAATGAHNAIPSMTTPFNKSIISSSAPPRMLFSRPNDKEAELQKLMRDADEIPATPFTKGSSKSVRHDPVNSPLPASFRASRSGGPRFPNVSEASEDWSGHSTSSPVAPQGVVPMTPAQGTPVTPPLRRPAPVFNKVANQQGVDARNIRLEALVKNMFSCGQLHWLKDEFELHHLDMPALTKAFNDRHLDDRSVNEISNALAVVIAWDRENSPKVPSNMGGL